MAVELEYGIDIADDEAEKLLTVQDWLTHIESASE
jgi:acyl carrier protein